MRGFYWSLADRCAAFNDPTSWQYDGKHRGTTSTNINASGGQDITTYNDNQTMKKVIGKLLYRAFRQAVQSYTHP